MKGPCGNQRSNRIRTESRIRVLPRRIVVILVNIRKQIRRDLDGIKWWSRRDRCHSAFSVEQEERQRAQLRRDIVVLLNRLGGVER